MELDKAYEPKKYESDIYKLWEDSGAFQPAKNSKKEPFSIIMPPPNANGDLHVGHGMYTVEDIMTRYQRMQGRPTLWLPGTDHAGIETQVVYEKQLAKEYKSRFDLGRDKFYKAALDFTLKNKQNMIDQMKSLGLSADWSRLKFTLDPDILEIVYDTFKRLHDDGLIYRGNRIVNWCTACQSSFADIEVKYRTQEDSMYTLDYGSVKIATTRPETIFADSAVAVNPKDERYSKLVGKTAIIPLLDRPIPIIADAHVDPATGSGALKVTPGHSKDDYEIGLRHNLPEISVIDLNGIMINVPKELAGMNVEQARQKTVEMLKAAGKLLKTAPLSHSVGYHDRCGTMIEPLITEQWWLKVEPLVGPAVAAVESGKIDIIPKRFAKLYLNWLQNLRDWNISRQNWFGIRIPVYYKDSNDPEKQAYIVTPDESEAEKYYGRGNYRAETDTFDTWFSSSQWPFATLMTTGDFERFYPTAVMGTAREILYLWVTRMVMLGIYRTGKVPFKNVYLWGLVQDGHGQKMSKSKFNTLNPLELTSKYGTDALRLALTIGITPGIGGALSEEKVQGYRNFCNKLWNVARFILSQLPADYSPASPEAKNLADRWMLDKLQRAVKTVTSDLEKYRFSEAGQRVYSLLWDDFADWYVEANKVEPNPDLLVYGLETILKLLHPIAPFVTEVVWQKMPWQKDNLIVSDWPQISGTSAGGNGFEQIKALVSEIRNLKAEIGAGELKLIFTGSELLASNQALIKKLAGISDIERVGQGSGLALSSFDAWLDLQPQVVRAYLKKLQDKRDEQASYRDRLKKQLANAGYVKSAPAHIVAETKDRLAQAEMLLSKLDEQIATIRSD